MAIVDQLAIRQKTRLARSLEVGLTRLDQLVRTHVGTTRAGQPASDVAGF